MKTNIMANPLTKSLWFVNIQVLEICHGILLKKVLHAAVAPENAMTDFVYKK